MRKTVTTYSKVGNSKALPTKRSMLPNEPLQVTAARLRILLNVKGLVLAAALERER